MTPKACYPRQSVHGRLSVSWRPVPYPVTDHQISQETQLTGLTGEETELTIKLRVSTGPIAQQGATGRTGCPSASRSVRVETPMGETERGAAHRLGTVLAQSGQKGDMERELAPPQLWSFRPRPPFFLLPTQPRCPPAILPFWACTSESCQPALGDHWHFTTLTTQ